MRSHPCGWDRVCVDENFFVFRFCALLLVHLGGAWIEPAYRYGGLEADVAPLAGAWIGNNLMSR